MWRPYAERRLVFYLCNAVVLQVDDSGHGHLHAAKHRHHLQLLIIERRRAKVLNKGDESKRHASAFECVSSKQLRLLFHGAAQLLHQRGGISRRCGCTLCNTHIILLGASPEVDTACIAGDVEHSQALQTRQRHGNTVTLQRERRERKLKGRKAQDVRRKQLMAFCFP